MDLRVRRAVEPGTQASRYEGASDTSWKVALAVAALTVVVVILLLVITS